MGQGNDDHLAESGEREKQSAHISLVFESAVKRIFTGYEVEMTRPQGGARSLLHIRLTADGAGFSVGWADTCDGMAELYTLGKTLARSKRTWGREQTLPPMQYNRFLEVAKRVLEDFGMTVTIVAFTSGDVEPVRPRADTFPYLASWEERK